MARTTVDPEFLLKLKGCGLTTAEFTYYFPDAPHILCPNPLIRQFEDIHPHFPKLQAFLRFWSTTIEGKLARVRVAHAHFLTPVEFDVAGTELRLH